MKLDFTNFLYALSYALDAAEREVTGSTEEHGKRVAWIAMQCAKGLNLSELEMLDLITCAILHDCAIAEYVREELELAETRGTENQQQPDVTLASARHAQKGEEKVRTLPMRGNVENVILWHHENADGSGPFGKSESETNIFSQILRIADVIDISYQLAEMEYEDYLKMREMVEREAGAVFSKKAAELFLENVTWDRVVVLQKRGPLEILRETVPSMEFEYSDSELTRIGAFFTAIVDYKSSFTKDHSVGVAQKAQAMAEHYGFDHEKVVRFAFAGAMHDIGKMVVGNDILEKPDKLNSDEFKAMKNHAAETLRILSSIPGIEDIAQWAANHHEKLDGTGYSRRMPGEDQTFEDRLRACIDIYQALTEPRPYKDGLSHRRSIAIMDDMARDGKIDGDIVRVMDGAFGGGQEEEDHETEYRLTTKSWKCQVCGYIYEGDTPRTAITG